MSLKDLSMAPYIFYPVQVYKNKKTIQLYSWRQVLDFKPKTDIVRVRAKISSDRTLLVDSRDRDFTQ